MTHLDLGPGLSLTDLGMGRVALALARPAFRHYRLFVVSNAGAPLLSIAELQLRRQPGGPQIAAGGVAAATSEFSGDFGAANAFDGAFETFWSTATGTPSAIVTYALPEAAPVVEYAITCAPARPDGTSRTGQAPVSWILEGSDDGVTWYMQHGVSDAGPWQDGQTKTFSVR